jgi:hypothetical protein
VATHPNQYSRNALISEMMPIAHPAATKAIQSGRCGFTSPKRTACGAERRLVDSAVPGSRRRPPFGATPPKDEAYARDCGNCDADSHGPEESEDDATDAVRKPVPKARAAATPAQAPTAGVSLELVRDSPMRCWGKC